MKKTELFVIAVVLVVTIFTNKRAMSGPVFPMVSNESLDGSSKAMDIAGMLSVVLSIGSSVAITKGVKSNVAEKKDIFQQRFTANPRSMKRDLKRLNGPQYKWLISTLLNVKPSKRKQVRCKLNNHKKVLNLLIDQAAELTEEKTEILYNFFVTSLQEVEENTKQDFCTIAD